MMDKDPKEPAPAEAEIIETFPRVLILGKFAGPIDYRAGAVTYYDKSNTITAIPVLWNKVHE